MQIILRHTGRYNEQQHDNTHLIGKRISPYITLRLRLLRFLPAPEGT